MARRMYYRHTRAQQLITDLLHHYTTEHTPGTFQDYQQLFQNRPAPPPLYPGRAAWKPKGPVRGLVGYVLASLHYAGATIDSHLFIHVANETPVSILHTPQQHTKSSFLAVATRARTRAQEQSRQTYKGLHEIDMQVYKQATKDQPTDNKRILMYHHTAM